MGLFNFWKKRYQSDDDEWRDDPRYEAAKKKSLKRDKYKCTVCGSKKNLHSHHVSSGSVYPELRYSVGNLVTLCEKCHLKKGSIHWYLGGTSTPCNPDRYNAWLMWRKLSKSRLIKVEIADILIAVAIGVSVLYIALK